MEMALTIALWYGAVQCVDSVAIKTIMAWPSHHNQQTITGIGSIHNRSIQQSVPEKNTSKIISDNQIINNNHAVALFNGYD